jgi:hypothetical protein
MEKTIDILVVEEDIGGTGAISFQATGVQKHWQEQDESELDTGESTKVLGRVDSQKAPQKVSRSSKK